MQQRSPIDDGDTAARWRLQLHLGMTTSLAAVQYAVFPDDARARFKAELERMQPRFERLLRQREDAAERSSLRLLQLKTVWDGLFRSVTGNHVYLLTAGLSNTVVTSNDVAAQRWVVTKAEISADRAFCWCLSFGAEAGHEVTLTLDESNSLDLVALAATSRSPEGTVGA